MYSVLVIDDERMICDMVKQVLERRGYLVDAAENAREGMEKYDNGQYNLVITDVCMPGDDGRTVARYIRNSKHDPAPVIGLSGTPWLLQNGNFDDVLSKPFAIHALIEKVENLTRVPLAV